RERRCPLLGSTERNVPFRGPRGDALEVLVAGEHRGRRLRAPAREPGIAVGAVADQCEPVRNRRGRDAELAAHSVLVSHFACATVELDDPAATDALRQILVRRAHDDLLDTAVALGHRGRRGERVVGLQLDHGPDNHAERSQRIFHRLELREQQRIDSLAGLVPGPERVPEGLDDVIGGDAHVRGAALEHAEDRPDDPAHRSELRWRAPVEGRRGREEVAEQLVRAVEQVDDHEGEITKTPYVSWGLRRRAVPSLYHFSHNTYAHSAWTVAADANNEPTTADLMRRAFDIDVLACPRCGGRLRLIATVEDPDAIRAILVAGTRS